MSKTGYIHSIESFATMEGDGIRMAVFMSGCPLRCVYCHNPDTWAAGGGVVEYTPEALADKADRYADYYKSGGGVTFTGGEPLLQSEFLSEALKACKNRGYHTAIDTSGALIPDNIDAIIDNTDLFIIDLKFYTESDYRKYSGGTLAKPLKLMRLVNERGKELRLRTVVMPGVNDAESDIDAYLEVLGDIETSEYRLQGYHTMGVYKYAELGLEYRLPDMPDMDGGRLGELQTYLDAKLGKK